MTNGEGDEGTRNQEINIQQPKNVTIVPLSGETKGPSADSVDDTVPQDARDDIERMRERIETLNERIDTLDERLSEVVEAVNDSKQG